MKQFIKYTAILGAVLSVLGFGTAWAAKINGGNWRRDDIGNTLYSFPYSGKYDPGQEYGGNHVTYVPTSETEYQVNVAKAQEDNTLCFPASKTLKLEMEAGEIIVTAGEVSDIRISCDDPGRMKEFLRIYKDNEDDELEIYVEGTKGKDGLYPKLNVVVPANFQFHEVEIGAATGSIQFTGLKTQELEVNITAGNVTIQEAVVSDADFKCASGNISYSGTIQGDADGECATGNISLSLMQKESDFNYDLEGVGGSIQIGDMEFSGLAFERLIKNNALHDMEFECVTGSIQVIFNGE